MHPRVPEYYRNPYLPLSCSALTGISSQVRDEKSVKANYRLHSLTKHLLFPFLEIVARTPLLYVASCLPWRLFLKLSSAMMFSWLVLKPCQRKLVHDEFGLSEASLCAFWHFLGNSGNLVLLSVLINRLQLTHPYYTPVKGSAGLCFLQGVIYTIMSMGGSPLSHRWHWL